MSIIGNPIIIGGDNLKTESISVTAYKSYNETDADFIPEYIDGLREQGKVYLFRIDFLNNTSNYRAGEWIVLVYNGFYSGYVKRVGLDAHNNLDYGINVYAGSTIKIQYFGVPVTNMQIFATNNDYENALRSVGVSV